MLAVVLALPFLSKRVDRTPHRITFALLGPTLSRRFLTCCYFRPCLCDFTLHPSLLLALSCLRYGCIRYDFFLVTLFLAVFFLDVFFLDVFFLDVFFLDVFFLAAFFLVALRFVVFFLAAFFLVAFRFVAFFLTTRFLPVDFFRLTDFLFGAFFFAFAITKSPLKD